MRIQAETLRTCNQLRLFADLLDDGSWIDARIDRRDTDIRSLLQPLGPVAVFGPSNFPLAFSVAGGDTASALAAGCPVIVMAHYAHPGTSEWAGVAIRDAIRDLELPEGVFSLLFGADYRVGTSLVKQPQLSAAAFTGSREGGEALRALIAERDRPIPFFAEMSSTNPVFVLPQALQTRGAEIAAGLHGSVTLGVGQFCTNPGLVFIPEGDAGQDFARTLSELMAKTPEAPMLTAGICRTYRDGVNARAADGNLEVILQQPHDSGAALFRTDAARYLAQPALSAELFGPATVLVTYADADQLLKITEGLEGQLTATLHGTDADLAEHSELLHSFAARAGRLVFNGFPTGVEVCPAMVHGGPYPATSDGQFTSVGTRAIMRFVRPVCYQNAPADLLPAELQDANPLGIMRLVDGKPTRDPLR
jgi:NADP-dependent aldehyde dehydrogenase